MLKSQWNKMTAILLFICLIVTSGGQSLAVYAADDGAGGPALTIVQSGLIGEFALDLSDVGNVDWLHLKGNGINNLTQIKKAGSNAVTFTIQTATTGYEGKPDRGGDANYLSYSWNDGMAGYESGNNDTGFGVFFPSSSRDAGSYSNVGWSFTVEPQPQETTVVFGIGMWQANVDVRFFADDEWFDTREITAGGTSQVFRYQVKVPANVELRVDGLQTDALSGYGNMSFSGLAVSSEEVVDKVNLQNEYNKVKEMTQRLYTDATWLPFVAAREAASETLGDSEATQQQVDDALAFLQWALSALAKRETNIGVDYTGFPKGEYEFGNVGDQRDRYQTFTPDEAIEMEYVQVNVRKASANVGDLVVRLHETNMAGLPMEPALTSTTISESEVADGELTLIPLDYVLEAGQRYALVLTQTTLGTGNYRWLVMNHIYETQSEYFGKSVSGSFVHEAGLGTGMLRIIKYSDVDKGELRQLLNETNAYNSKLYTSATWSHLQLKKKEAMERLGDVDATQESVNEMTAILEDAISGLLINPASINLEGYVDQLERAVVKGYTEQSVAVLREAVAEAKATEPSASQWDKLKAMTAMMNAIDNLAVTGKYRYETHPGMTAAFGFEGDKNASLAFMDGSYQIGGVRPEQHGPIAPKQMVTFGVSDAEDIKWYKGEGYLPVFINEYMKDEMSYKIETFAGKHTVDNKDYVVNYSRMTVTNHSQETRLLPAVSRNLVPLNDAAGYILIVEPGQTVARDYVIEADKYEYFDEAVTSFTSLTLQQLVQLGSFDANYAAMKYYWDTRMAALVQIDLPNKELVNAFKAGYIDTMIIKDDTYLHVGENGYARLYSHDTLGIMVQLVQSGDFDYAKDYLKSIPLTGGINIETGTIDGNLYWDTNWKLPWAYAVYISKTGDYSIVDEIMTADDGSVGTIFDKRIKVGARSIETDRTSEGIMKPTLAIDSLGSWTIDNYSALTGLAAYEYLTRELHERTNDGDYLIEAEWASEQYADLLDKFTARLQSTITSNNLNYIPGSVIETNDQNRMADSRDANWASMYLFGRWLWDGYLYGAEHPEDNINLTMLDDTYTYGIERRQAEGTTDSPYNFGGYPHGFYSSSYNAGYGSAALRGEQYRDMGIKAYEFMIENSMSAPFSWWEGIYYPTNEGWQQTNDHLNIQHTRGGGGSAQHIWGQSVNSKVLIDSLIAERIFDQNRQVEVIVGRGIPKEWVTAADLNGNVIADVQNYPVLEGGRVGYRIVRDLDTLVVTLNHNLGTSGNLDKDVRFSIQLPIMVGNISGASAGTIDVAKGIVSVPLATSEVTISLTSLAATAEAIKGDAEALAIGYAVGDSSSSVKRQLQLPTAGENGSIISWTSSHPDIISQSGTVSRPAASTEVTLTATLQLDGMELQKTFALTVAKRDETGGNTGNTGGNNGNTGTEQPQQNEDEDENIGEPGGNEEEEPSPNIPELSFTDLADHWARNAIRTAVERQIVNGYPDGTFRPDGIVTRSEFVVMLGRATSSGVAQPELGFKDIASIPEWARAYVAGGVAGGIIQGYEDNTFRPYGTITRLELTAMIVRALGLKSDTVELAFADKDQVPAWGRSYVAAAYEAGIIEGKGNNIFAPNDRATRAEAITLILRALQLKEQH